MRLWSIHPKYLDQKGLCGLWREALQAQSVLLQGEYKKCPECAGLGIVLIQEEIYYDEYDCEKCKGRGKIKTSYWNHPQLERFKNSIHPLLAINIYLYCIYKEGIKRGYNFDYNKILKESQINIPNNIKGLKDIKLTVTIGQLKYEMMHLHNKLRERDIEKDRENANDITIYNTIFSHPLFQVIEGNIESWEKVK